MYILFTVYSSFVHSETGIIDGCHNGTPSLSCSCRNALANKIGASHLCAKQSCHVLLYHCKHI